MKRYLFVGALLLGWVTMTSLAYAEETAAPVCDQQKDPYCFQPLFSQSFESLKGVNLPKIATPSWASPSAPVVTEVTYSVATRGTVTADLAEFKSVAAATYNSPLGWSRLGVKFTEVASGGRFTLWLSEASQMTTFSAAGCDTTYSCAVGSNVIINQDRWVNGADPFISAGGSLADYRSMVLNHELGHWLGHGHRLCSGAGQPAPLMQQQSMGMQGCALNAWPLAGELTSSTLGIRS